MTAEEELAPVLAKLRSSHDVLPFLDQQIAAHEAVFRRMPEAIVDVLISSGDFVVPPKGTAPVWIQISGEGGGTAELVIARPEADGELWVIARQGS